MDIDTFGNVEDIHVDSSAQPQEGHQQQDDHPLQEGHNRKKGLLHGSWSTFGF